MAALTKEQVLEWKGAEKQAKQLKKVIENRIDHILRAIYKSFGKKLQYWYFYGAGEGEVGPLPIWEIDHTDGVICPIIEPYLIGKSGWVRLNTTVWHLGEDGFPARWLYNDDFEDELEIGIQAYKAWEIETRQKKEQRKLNAADKKQRTLDSIKAKLTPEEVKLLKL